MTTCRSDALPELREDTHGVIPYAGGSALSLYTIESELNELLDLRESAEGEGALPEELAAIDKSIAEYFSREVKKADGICHAIRTYEMAAEIAKKEADRIRDRAKSLQARADRIKSSALYALQAHGVTKVETPTNALRVQKNGGLEPLSIDPTVEVAPYLQDVTVTMPGDVWDGLEVMKSPSLGSIHYPAWQRSGIIPQESPHTTREITATERKRRTGRQSRCVSGITITAARNRRTGLGSVSGNDTASIATR